MTHGEERRVEGELPEGWRWVRLEEVTPPEAPIIYGILQPGPNVTNGVPYVRPTEIQGDVIQLGDIRRTSAAIAKKYNRSVLRTGDVLLSIVGTIGKVAIVPQSLEGGNITQSSVRIRPKRGVEGQFLTALLKAPEAFKQYDDLRLGTGVPRLNVGDVRELKLPLPRLLEQRRIVAKLESLQARSRRAREALEAVPALLEKLRQSILAAAFRGDLTADWRAKHPDVEPASELLKRIRIERRKKWEEAELAKLKAKGKTPTDDKWKQKYVEPEPVDDSDLPELPEGWVWTSVEESGQVDLGRMRSPDKHAGDNVCPYLRVKNVFEDRIDVNDVMEMQFEPEEFEYYRLMPGDILLNEGQSKELVGRPAMFRGELPNVAFTNSLIRFRPFGHAPPEYALAVFRHYMRSGRFQSIAQITTNIAHLGANRLRTLKFPLAPAAEQREIAEAVRKALAGVDSIQESLKELLCMNERLDSSILSKAFRGELVPQDPNDLTATHSDASTTLDVAASTKTPKGPKGKALRRR